MNRNQFITLVVLGLLVGGLGIYFANKQKDSFSHSSFQAGQKVLPEFPLNDVGHLRLKQGTNEVNLVLGADSWGVKERWSYPANFSAVSEFLRKMWALKPVQDVEAGPSQYGRLELNTPSQGSTNSGTLVEFKNAKGTNLRSVVLGKTFSREGPGGSPFGGGEMPVGRYLLVPGDQPKVWLVSETFSDIGTDPAQWLNKDFFKVEKIKSISVQGPTNSWSLARETETGEWKLAEPKEGENFDPAKASSLNYALSSPSFEDVAAPEFSGEQPEFKDGTKATIATFEGFNYTIHLASTKEDNYLMNVQVEGSFPQERSPGADEKPEDKEKLDKEFLDALKKKQEKLTKEQAYGKWVYKVGKWTVDPLLKSRSDFMAEEKTEAPAQTTNEGTDNPPEPPIEVLPPELDSINP